MKQLAAIVAAFISNSLIVYLFVRALASPENYIDFIYGSAFAIFLLEFLGIHSSGILSGILDDTTQLRQRLVKGVPFLLFYSVFAIVATILAGSIYPLLIFVLGMVAKVLFMRQSTTRNAHIAMGVFLLVSTVLLTSFAAPLLAAIFPFPETVLTQKPENISGLFVDTPQTLLVWGVLYFTLSTIGEIWLTMNPKHATITMHPRQ